MIHSGEVHGLMRAAAAKEPRASAPARTAVGTSAAAPRRRPLRGAALWTTLGFVCGAIFWHAVGFWTFMSQLIFEGTETVMAERAPTNDIETGSLPTIVRVDPASCISLELDRRSNRTALRPCPRDGLALRLEAEGGRGDLALLADQDLP